ncbi:unnamed protein product [Adineta steineri]|uniref:G-protein coupled receptors family 1 profile domain-containing protein n=1 Tax=Adineta steineri TaxID=433720 RepID=A0A814FHW9_9BILA|nr:unnamed protein product [Adineta steineri]CAF0983214.1 unnamed protein product [Adineta steineri]
MTNSTVTLDVVFNLFSFIIDTISFFVCLILLSAIIYRIIEIKYKHGQLRIDIPLILTINIICSILIKSILQIIHVTIPTLIKDYQIISNFQETSFSRLRAYILWSVVGVLYWSYTLLAFFRFTRVIYSTKRWLHRSSLYSYILIPCQYVFAFINMLPLLVIFNSLHLIPNEGYCGVSFKELYPTFYVTIMNYMLPISIISIFYVCIFRKMRETTAIRQEQELDRRDYIVIRRMLFTIATLSTLSIPYTIVYILSIITNQNGSIFYRIQWFSASICSCLFSLTLPLINTQLSSFLRSNRLTPVNHQA